MTVELIAATKSSPRALCVRSCGLAESGHVPAEVAGRKSSLLNCEGGGSRPRDRPAAPPTRFDSVADCWKQPAHQQAAVARFGMFVGMASSGHAVMDSNWLHKHGQYPSLRRNRGQGSETSVCAQTSIDVVDAGQEESPHTYQPSGCVRHREAHANSQNQVARHHMEPGSGPADISPCPVLNRDLQQGPPFSR